MKILFLVPYPLKESASQRFRFEQYLEILLKYGHSYKVQSFLNSSDWKILYEKGKIARKVIVLGHGLIRRLFILFHINRFDLIFIHREAMPLGPPAIEWVIAKILKKKIIFDFDDAIWLTDRQNEPGWLSAIKWRKKIEYLCQWSYKVSVGNVYLCDYARKFNERVVLNPSTIDAVGLHVLPPSTKKSGEVVIGWTGSHSTMKYLYELEPVLKQLEETHPNITILIIADQRPLLSLKTIRFVPWSQKTEIKDLAKIDIGIMPLQDDVWTKGKCGFKALQYMSLEKPALVSPVGANLQIVEHGITGFHCATAEDWLNYAGLLISRKDICDTMGKRGREWVIRHYSVTSNTPNFLSLLE